MTPPGRRPVWALFFALLLVPASLFCFGCQAREVDAQPSPNPAPSPGTASDEPAEAVDGFERIEGIDAWSEAIAAAYETRWVGARVPWPAPKARPESPGPLRSFLHPVNVHAPSGVAPELAEQVLHALEEAHQWLAFRGWPTPLTDGGRGGTAGFDLYLLPATHDSPSVAPESEFDLAVEPSAESLPEPRRWARPRVDAPSLIGGVDRAQTFLELDDDIDPGRLKACVISSYVQAGLLSADPAEAPAWRIATGDFLAWLQTGQFGCSDEGLIAQQHQSHRTWIGHSPESGEGGALFLAMLSARTDRGTGRFIRDLWQGATQRTWEGDALRASPDLWEVVEVVMGAGQDPLPRLLTEMGITRYLWGNEGSARSAQPGTGTFPLELSLPAGARVPVLGHIRYDQLPRRYEPHGALLQAQGSAYIEVNTRDVAPGSQLRVWLQGEYGVAWSLTVLRLDADGSTLGSVAAPVRPRDPRAYVPLELTSGRTAKVAIIVTNLGAHWVDADEGDQQARAFRLILDQGQDRDADDEPDDEGAEHADAPTP